MVNEIYDPRIYTKGIPYDAYARLRSTTPVSWCPERAYPGMPAGPGFWAVMRHDDVRHVSRTPGTFSASLACTQVRDPDPADLDFLRAMLLNMDPPQHNSMRKTISPLFTDRNLVAVRTFIDRTAEELVLRARAKGEFDLVEDVTDMMALSTLAELLGVPESDRTLFYDWANRIIGYQDDEYSPDSTETVDPRSPAALRDMHEYAEGLREYRRRNPGDDVISTLVHSRIDGRPLTDAEFKNFFFLFAVAGNDTTRSALPGGLLALLHQPDQFALLRREPELLDSAIEECLRYAPPVILFRRTAVHDVVLRGQEITAGDKVVVFYPAANRDPAAFENPDAFQIRRAPNRHVSFGYGPHICVAASVARHQMRAMFSAIMRHIPHLTVRGPVDRLASNLVAGIKRIPASTG